MTERFNQETPPDVGAFVQRICVPFELPVQKADQLRVQRSVVPRPPCKRRISKALAQPARKVKEPNRKGVCDLRTGSGEACTLIVDTRSTNLSDQVIAQRTGFTFSLRRSRRIVIQSVVLQWINWLLIAVALVRLGVAKVSVENAQPLSRR